MRLYLFVLFMLLTSCAKTEGAHSQNSARNAQTYSGRSVTFCDEAKLNACIAGSGGGTCINNHCSASIVSDDVCATSLVRTCLEAKGGSGCKKFCGHPLQCLKKKGFFDCDSQSCRCFTMGDAGIAPPSPVGNFFIELIGTAGVSFVANLTRTVVSKATQISATAATTNAVRALASSLDDTFGAAYSMGARAGLRMTAHSHEIGAGGVIKTASQIVKTRISEVKRMALPQLGQSADNYIWLIDDAGNFIIAPEVKIAARQTLGHPTLCGGCNARIAGEVLVEKTGDSGVRFIINNQSGRYFNDFTNGPKHLENAAKVLKTIVGEAPVEARFMDF